MPYNKSYKKIFAKIENLIQLNNEILIEHYIRRYTQRYYFIDSLNAFESFIKSINPSDFATIYKEKQLHLRSFANEEFYEKVLNEYKNQDWKHYAFFDFKLYPKELEPYGAGSSLEELKDDIKELMDEYKPDELYLCFGQDPRPINSKIHLDEDDKFIVIGG